MSSAITAAECRYRYAGAFRPKPWIYWGDFSLSAGIGWAAFALSIQNSIPSLAYFIATLIAILALLRAAIFIHELSHLKRGAVPGFKTAWNLVVGIPFMLPSLMYVGSHGDHHRQATFGTVGDPEYVSLARWSLPRLLWFVVGIVIVPVLLAFRWGVLGPLSFFIPPLRRFAVEQASSLVINPAYRRPFPTGRALRWRGQEIATGLVFWLAVGFWFAGLLPSPWLGQWYIVSAGILLVNQVRTLTAHRYNNDGRPLTSVEQLLDSINLDGWPVPTVLAAPVGLRYHALHHFLPAVPYHSLGALHRQLREELPSDSPYHQATCKGIFSTIWGLIISLQTVQKHRVIASAAKQSLPEKEMASSPEPALSPVEGAPRNDTSSHTF